MERKRKSCNDNDVKDFRHDEAKRKNNPPVGLASTYECHETEKTQYSYDPHLDPQLIWAGKAEHTSFDVDVVSLHIHERISTKAILRAATRKEQNQLELFAEPPLPADKQIEFYKHEVGWSNRMILGDSLLVMNSLLVKEGMAGKIQMIYFDPPYGIKFSSNFQPSIDKRDVKDQDADLTHEPEQIQAYRDTWKLGIHSYLTYLRDRLLLARELLTESGSIFVQINDENLHLVRCLLDEVFGRENFVAVISFVKTSGQTTSLLASISDYLIWYSKNKNLTKFRQIFWGKELGTGIDAYQYAEFYPHFCRRIIQRDKTELKLNLFRQSSVTSQGFNPTTFYEYEFNGKKYLPQSNRHWSTVFDGLKRLENSERLISTENTLNFKRFLNDFPLFRITNNWFDVGSVSSEKLYAVQTNPKVIERCILMTTDPGDLVFDPTCGSGTTAYCAEKWGRRWIVCDTSRVAISIARQRLMTAKFDFYQLRDPQRGPSGGFIYETVPHITLESIAKNEEIDVISEKYQPQIDRTLSELNEALKTNWKEWEVPREVPHPVWGEEAVKVYWKLYEVKQKCKGIIGDQKDLKNLSPDLFKKLNGKIEFEKINEWLNTIYRLTGHIWDGILDVPEPVPSDEWSNKAKEALKQFWELKRQKRKEIDESIQRNAPQETLYDRPLVERGVVRVSGPFTVEAIPMPAVEDPSKIPIPQLEEEQDGTERVSDRGGDYLTTMINLLSRQGGLLFPGNKKMVLTNIRPLNTGYLHAEAESGTNGKTLRVALSFGPPHGPLTAIQVREAIPTAQLNKFDFLVFAGFSIDPEAQAFVQKIPAKDIQIHFVHISPDVLVGDLLKASRASQIFTVFGEPDVELKKNKDGTYCIKLKGVDIYDPISGQTESRSGNEVAAWFLDTDYDGMTFHICQAFFPSDEDAWEKLQRALKAQIDPQLFEKMKGTESFPFTAGKYNRIAVKVIDFRGNEVIRIVNLGK